MRPPGLRALDEELDRLVEDTPRRRDRYVDFLRVFSIGVVVVWHWALSLTHRQDGALVMPNPLDVVPGSWLLTWLFQIMPLFFFVGGFANHAGWTAVVRDGGGALTFYRQRFRRLLLPPLVFVVAWALLEAVLHAARADHRSVIEWGEIVFMPFWFLAAYVWVVALVPLTARLHDAGGPVALAALASLVALVDVGRFALGVEWLGYVNSALVWVVVHQLGYFYRDGTLARIGSSSQLWLAAVAAAALLALTSLPAYPRSMVATRDLDFSHMWPTTAMIMLVALLQASVAMRLRPAVSRWLRRRSVWKIVVAVNTVILTVFVWHMTAKVAVIGVYETAGFTLHDEPTVDWWLQRPLWLIAPTLVLALLAVVFARFEIRSGRR